MQYRTTHCCWLRASYQPEPAENVPVPGQLWDIAGIKKIKDLFKTSFAKSRRLQLHCVKLACCWPDHRSAYADLLGNLVSLGDVEALAYQYPGQQDMLQVSNKLLKQVSLLFMLFNFRQFRTTHSAMKCRRQIVLCSCLRDLAAQSILLFSSVQIQIWMRKFQRRNFRVVVLHHMQQPNRKPTNSMNVADEAYDWLTYLKQELHMAQLTLPSQSSGSYAPGPPHVQNGTMHTPPRPPPPPAHVASAPRSNSASRTLPLPYQPGNQLRPLSAGPPPPAKRQVLIVNGGQVKAGPSSNLGQPVNAPNTVGPSSNTRRYVTAQITAGPSSNPQQPVTPQNTGGPGSNPRQPVVPAATSHQQKSGPGNALSRIIPDLLPEDSDSKSSRDRAVPPALYLPSKPQPGAKAPVKSGPTDAQVHTCNACMLIFVSALLHDSLST